MSDEILTVFEKETAAREKYIYFVCGVAGALFAYIGKDFSPVHPLTCVAILTISAMAALALSLAIGMAHIQCFIQALSKNKDILVNKDDLKKCNMSIFKYKTGEANYTRDLMTGEEPTIEVTEERIKALTAIMAQNQQKMHKWVRGALISFTVCHVFLMLGFLLLILSKFVT
jgi:hypothetical protein